MWALYATAGAVIVTLGIALPLAYHARKVSRQLGKAKGEVDALEKEIRRLRGALIAQGELVAELGKPDATPGVLADVLRREAAAGGSSAD